ncbi:hypothetical protein BO70DRAFT_83212 [Aspergillus heteromorphus CBS 117.55]|uniref:Uncharacterized protein n=1 Tax=Aspergillus heteromorphus CBS 117.55 TaxID=1448321 RepID=A0A317WXA2_9EURO|nr:uncharacterized protein BO70DRAFT_83212 [Aspergillus heteromorphus CBS 117.55]PWY91024.1 hypothetical protein BO70DRAFT_83212 [Aspergillus heteromorphus CBS 117.55]
MRWFCGLLYIFLLLLLILLLLLAFLFPFFSTLLCAVIILYDLHDPLSLSCLFLDITLPVGPCCSSNEPLAAVVFLSMLMSLSHGQKQVM